MSPMEAMGSTGCRFLQIKYEVCKSRCWQDELSVMAFFTWKNVKYVKYSEKKLTKLKNRDILI